MVEIVKNLQRQGAVTVFIELVHFVKGTGGAAAIFAMGYEVRFWDGIFAGIGLPIDKGSSVPNCCRSRSISSASSIRCTATSDCNIPGTGPGWRSTMASLRPKMPIFRQRTLLGPQRGRQKTDLQACGVELPTSVVVWIGSWF